MVKAYKKRDRDCAEAIELFEHTLDKKVLVWFQEHEGEFVDVTT